MPEQCRWCPHPISRHTDYYGGWCCADVTVINDGDVPYCLSCWCGGTEETAGPRQVTSQGSTQLVADGAYWVIPDA